MGVCTGCATLQAGMHGPATSLLVPACLPDYLAWGAVVDPWMAAYTAAGGAPTDLLADGGVGPLQVGAAAMKHCARVWSIQWLRALPLLLLRATCCCWPHPRPACQPHAHPHDMSSFTCLV